MRIRSRQGKKVLEEWRASMSNSYHALWWSVEFSRGKIFVWYDKDVKNPRNVEECRRWTHGGWYDRDGVVQNSNKLDPLADGTIEMMLSKIVEFKDFTMFRGITMQDVKGHLLERWNIYMRVCELANHPNVIGFLQSFCKIWMRPEVYEMHIKVTLIQF